MQTLCLCWCERVNASDVAHLADITFSLFCLSQEAAASSMASEAALMASASRRRGGVTHVTHNLRADTPVRGPGMRDHRVLVTYRWVGREVGRRHQIVGVTGG